MNKQGVNDVKEIFLGKCEFLSVYGFGALHDGCFGTAEAVREVRGAFNV